MSNIKIAYFGHPGSFSFLAAKIFIKKNAITKPYLYPCQTSQEVLDYVQLGKCYGVLPYYNSTTGAVEEENESVNQHPELVVDDIAVPVHHYLLAKSNIKNPAMIVSHPQALKQCQSYLKRKFPGVKQLSYSTTSTAAYDLANKVLPLDCLVIASYEAAKKYDLKILDSKIEDKADNTTHFKVLYAAKDMRNGSS